MLKRIFVYTQYILPQHLLTRFLGNLADSRVTWFKNFVIRWFIKRYKVNMREAVEENPENYPNFNQFFIRKLKPELRPIDTRKDIIVSPVDGVIAQVGNIQKNQLLQVKNHYFNLEALFGGHEEFAKIFYDGAFITLYLAPNNYHRVHMPFTGVLEKTIYIPGHLFSVNRMTSDLVSNLYARNERLVSLFRTSAGTMAIILVGALIVGGIETAWRKAYAREKKIVSENFSGDTMLTKGEELGFFKMGSTVILLFPKNKIDWLSAQQSRSSVQLGQPLGNIKIENMH